MAVLKAAVIGAGQIASAVHLPGYRSLPEEVEVAAVSDLREEAAAELAGRFGVPRFFADHRELLAEMRPDLVSVCVPNKFHHPIVLDCLAAGCHVLCEKPPALTLPQAEEIDRAARDRGLLVSYNFHHRHRPEVQAMAAMVKGGELGLVYAAEVQAVRRRAIPGWGSFTSRELQGGGALIDLGIHMLDSALYVLGYPQPVYACASMFDHIGRQGGEGIFGSWRGEHINVEDSAFGFLVFEGGLTMSLTASFALHNSQAETTRMNLNLYGDQAGVSLAPFVLHTSEGAVQIDRTMPVAGPPGGNLAGVRDFVQSVSGGALPVVTSENVLLTQRLVDALYRSAREKKPVMLGG